MSALGKLVVSLALEYAQYTQGLDKADQEALKFAQNAQRHFDSATSAAKEFFIGTAQGALGAATAYLSVSQALARMKTSIDEMDKLDELSEKLMVDTTTLQEFAYAGKLTGVELEGIATGVKKLNVNMTEAITGGKEQAAVFKALGISVKGADGNLRSAKDVMFDVADVFAGLEDPAIKTTLAIKLFGKQGADMIPLLSQGAEGIKKLTDEAHSLGGVLSSEQLKSAADFNDNLDKMATLSSAASKQFTAQFLPAINDVIKRLIEAQKESKGFIEALNTAVTMTFNKASGESYANQLTQENRRFAVEYIADEETRAARLLEIDAELWRERIALARSFCWSVCSAPASISARSWKQGSARMRPQCASRPKLPRYSAESGTTSGSLSSRKSTVNASRKPTMMNLLKSVPILLALQACASAPPSVQALPDPPKRRPPAAALQPIPEAGWFVKTLDEILTR